MAYLDTRATNVYEIRSAADLDDLATAGVITIAADTKLNFVTTVPIVTANRFEITTGELLMEGMVGPVAFVYVGGGTLFTGVSSSPDAALDINEINFIGNGTGTLINWDALGIVEMDNCAFIQWLSLGSVRQSQFSTFRNIPVLGFGTGFTIDTQNLFVFTMGPAPGSPTTGQTFINFKSSGTDTGGVQITNSGTFNQDPYIRVDPDTVDGVGINITLGTFGTTPDIFDTTGTDGSFTAVANAAVAPTAIQTVQTNAGVAVFESLGGVTVYNGQEVSLSGFAESTYNVTGIVQNATTGGTITFEVRVGYTPVAYVADDAGGYSSNSVTVTSTAHGLSDGQTLFIDTALSTDYDGGATIYNAQTNTFQINRTFTITHTGTWSTRGLDETNPKVLASSNPGQADSQYIGSFHVNSNSTATIINTINTWTDLNLDGSALISSNNQRFKLTNLTTGELEYIGNEPFSGNSVTSITGLGQGGQDDYEFRVIVNGAPTSDGIVAGTSTNAQGRNISLVAPVELVKGDLVRLQVQNTSGNDNWTVLQLAVNIQ